MKYPNFSSGKPHIYYRRKRWIVRWYDRVMKRVRAYVCGSHGNALALAKHMYETRNS